MRAEENNSPLSDNASLGGLILNIEGVGLITVKQNKGKEEETRTKVDQRGRTKGGTKIMYTKPCVHK